MSFWYHCSQYGHCTAEVRVSLLEGTIPYGSSILVMNHSFIQLNNFIKTVWVFWDTSLRQLRKALFLWLLHSIAHCISILDKSAGLARNQIASKILSLDLNPVWNKDKQKQQIQLPSLVSYCEFLHELECVLKKPPSFFNKPFSFWAWCSVHGTKWKKQFPFDTWASVTCTEMQIVPALVNAIWRMT